MIKRNLSMNDVSQGPGKFDLASEVRLKLSSRKISSWELDRFFKFLAHKFHYEVKHLCVSLGLNRRLLERAFQRQLGASPRGAFNRYRMIQARGRLAEGQSVKFVSLELSYRSTTHFDAAFRQCYGCCPTDFVKHLGLSCGLSSP
jgi:AraC-like DNA-binding protein